MGGYNRRRMEEAAIAKWDGIPSFTDWECKKIRPMAEKPKRKPPTARERELIEALERTKAALVLLSPALNTMARECLADIVAREIDATLSQHKRGGA